MMRQRIHQRPNGKRTAIASAALGISLLGASTVALAHPPAWAPANGYRYHHAANEGNQATVRHYHEHHHYHHNGDYRRPSTYHNGYRRPSQYYHNVNQNGYQPGYQPGYRPAYGPGPGTLLGKSGRQTVGSMVGGALGGFVGSQIGKGSGKLAATAAGALLGYTLGGNVGWYMDNQHHQYGYGQSTYQPAYANPVPWGGAFRY